MPGTLAARSSFGFLTRLPAHFVVRPASSPLGVPFSVHPAAPSPRSSGIQPCKTNTGTHLREHACYVCLARAPHPPSRCALACPLSPGIVRPTAHAVLLLSELAQVCKAQWLRRWYMQSRVGAGRRGCHAGCACAAVGAGAARCSPAAHLLAAFGHTPRWPPALRRPAAAPAGPLGLTRRSPEPLRAPCAH